MGLLDKITAGLAIYFITYLASANPGSIDSLTLTYSGNLTANPSVSGNDTSVKVFYTWFLNGSTFTKLYLPMDGGTLGAGGTVRDYANGNNGTVNNAVYSPTGGYDGRGAYVFDGVTDTLNISHSSDIGVASGQSFTIMAWGKTTDSYYRNIISKDGTDGTYYRFQKNSGGDVRLYIDDGPNYQSCDGITHGGHDGNWHHYVGVRDSEKNLILLYKDGINEKNCTLTATGPLSENNGDFRIGYSSGGCCDWNGTLDEVMFFKRALSDNEIRAIYQNRTDLIVANETSAGEVWGVCATSNDNSADSTTVCSSNITVGLSAPTINITIITDKTIYDLNEWVSIVSGGAQGDGINYLGVPNGARIINFSGEDDADPYNVDTINISYCSTPSWDNIHALCDNQTEGIQSTNNKTIAWAASLSMGSTWYNPEPHGSGAGVMIVDLNQTRTYNQLYVFQMFSDGKVTHVQLFENQSVPGTWTAAFNETFIGEGDYDDTLVYSPTEINFTSTTSQYVQLKFRNNGSYDDSSFIEVYSVKLFGGDSSSFVRSNINTTVYVNLTVERYDSGWVYEWNVTSDYAINLTANVSTDISTLWSSENRFNTDNRSGGLGLYRALASVFDNSHTLLSQSQYNFTISDLNPPNFTKIANLTVEYGDTVSLEINATDSIAVDTYTVNDTTNFQINNTGYLTNKTALDIRVYWLNITANDTSGNEAHQIIWVNITDTTPPTFTDIANLTGEAGNTLSIDINATDLSNVDTYTVNDTTNFQINTTGYLTNKTGLNVRIYLLNITVNDTHSNTNSHIITVNITDSGSPTLTLVNLTIEYGNPAAIDLNATDPSGIDRFIVNDTTDFQINCSGYLTNKTGISLGVYLLNITVNDTQSNTASGIMTVNVTDSTNPSTTLNTPSNGGSQSGGAITFNLTCSDAGNLANATLYVNISGESSPSTPAPPWRAVNATASPNNGAPTYLGYNLGIGSYMWNVICVDAQGNSDWADNNHTLTLNSGNDTDGDGVVDENDNLEGNETSVGGSGVTKLNITINGNSTNGTFNDVQHVVFYDSLSRMVNFTYNFSASPLDLSRIQIIKTPTSIIINLSGQLQAGYKKTVYLDDNSFIALCVKDAEIADISAVSAGCGGANETDFADCIGNSTGVTRDGITCTDEGDTIRVDNLTYSAVRGTQAPAGGTGKRDIKAKIKGVLVESENSYTVTARLDNKRDTGSLIMGATVQLTKDDNTILQSCTTDKNGRCELKKPGEGTYSITSEKNGYRPHTLTITNGQPTTTTSTTHKTIIPTTQKPTTTTTLKQITTTVSTTTTQKPTTTTLKQTTTTQTTTTTTTQKKTTTTITTQPKPQQPCTILGINTLDLLGFCLH